jgi:hypothetical protein
MGISNKLFPQERDETAACATVAAVNDRGPSIDQQADFMRLLAAAAFGVHALDRAGPRLI